MPTVSDYFLFWVNQSAITIQALPRPFSLSSDDDTAHGMNDLIFNPS
jgi:hypothetical protein